MTEWNGRSILRVDPESAEIVARIPVTTTPVLGLGGGGLTVGEGSVWIASHRLEGEGGPQAVLVRVDPNLNSEVGVVPLGGQVAGDVEIGEGAIWVSVHHRNDSTELVRLDPTTHEATQFRRAVATVSIAKSQFALLSAPTAPVAFEQTIDSVQADWDDESTPD